MKSIKDSMVKPKGSKKHKKIKAIDPFYTGERIADKKLAFDNLKPKSLEQEFSNSLKTFAANKLASSKKLRKRKHNSAIEICENLSVNEKGIKRPFQDIPKFQQRKGEKETNFLRRVDRETQFFLQNVKFEDKYEVNVYDPLKENDGIRNKKNDQHKNKEKHLKRLQVKKQKKVAKKKEIKNEKLLGFEKLKDEIKFGEVAMQPPELKFVKKKLLAKKPQNLLLDTKLENDELIKRDRLKPELIEERTRVIELYRKIKLSKTLKVLH